MNPVFKKHLDRRTFLRGAATVLGLPMLDAMVPALSSAATKAPLRMAFVYFPNGTKFPFCIWTAPVVKSIPHP